MSDVVKKLSLIIKDKKITGIAIFISVLYFLFYLWSLEHIIFTNSDLDFYLINDWQDKIFRERVPFVWEPIGVLSLSFVSIFLSVPNIVLGLILAFLVFLNLDVAIFSYYLPRVCNIKAKSGFGGILGMLPSFLTGFACCAPTFIIALAPLFAGITVFFIEIRPFLVPLSIILMIGGVWWATRRIPMSHIELFFKNRN